MEMASGAERGFVNWTLRHRRHKVLDIQCKTIKSNKKNDDGTYLGIVGHIIEDAHLLL